MKGTRHTDGPGGGNRAGRCPQYERTQSACHGQGVPGREPGCPGRPGLRELLLGRVMKYPQKAQGRSRPTGVHQGRPSLRQGGPGAAPSDTQRSRQKGRCRATRPTSWRRTLGIRTSRTLQPWTRRFRSPGSGSGRRNPSAGGARDLAISLAREHLVRRAQPQPHAEGLTQLQTCHGSAQGFAVSCPRPASPSG